MDIRNQRCQERVLISFCYFLFVLESRTKETRMKMRRLILRSERGEKKGFVSYENGAALRRVVSIETLEEHAASQKLIFFAPPRGYCCRNGGWWNNENKMVDQSFLFLAPICF